MKRVCFRVSIFSMIAILAAIITLPTIAFSGVHASERYVVSSYTPTFSASVLAEHIGEQHAVNLARNMAILDDAIATFHEVSNSAEAENTYNENFAGVWYDENGNLNIGITTRASRFERHPSVNYHVHRFSYNFLRRVQSAVIDMMAYKSIHEAAILQRNNHIEVIVGDIETKDNIIVNLTRLGLFKEGSVSFLVEENKMGQVGANINTGDRITRGNILLPHHATMAAMATCVTTNRRGIVSAAHVTGNEGTVVRHNGSTGTQIGRTSVAFTGGDVHAGFVPFDAPGNWNFSSSARIGNAGTIRATTYRTASRAVLREGLPVFKYGDATGWTVGKITSISAPFICGRTGNEFRDFIRHTARSHEGDSGAALFLFDVFNRPIHIGVVTHSAFERGRGFAMASNIW